MKLRKLMEKNRKAVLRAWFDEAINSYPDGSAQVFKNTRDPFSNPVGSTIQRELEQLYDFVVQGLDSEQAKPCLENIVRIRAVQDFSPSEAVSFIFALKWVVRNVLGEQVRGEDMADELIAFDKAVDRLGMFSFDEYTLCREKIYRIRVEEVKNRSARLLQRAGLLAELDKGDPDLQKQ